MYISVNMYFLAVDMNKKKSHLRDHPNLVPVCNRNQDLGFTLTLTASRAKRLISPEWLEQEIFIKISNARKISYHTFLFKRFSIKM
jgi:hypothetical protein